MVNTHFYPLFVSCCLLGLFRIDAAADDKTPQAVDREGEGLIEVGPEYKIDPDLTDKGNPKGQQFEFTMALAQSRIFKGDDKTLEPDKKPVNKERTIRQWILIYSFHVHT